MRTPGPVGIGWQARLARHAAGGLSRCVARRAVMARARDEMKALLAVALTILLLSAPARAQGVAGGPDASGSKGMSGGKHRNGAGTKTQEQKPKADDKDYRSAIGRLPDQKFDPWKDVR